MPIEKSLMERKSMIENSKREKIHGYNVLFI
jgi:hypothetical protein